MKTKPYISCPLQAALAAKNFGFSYTIYPTKEQIDEYDSSEPWDWLYSCHESYHDCCHIEDAIAYIEEASSHKIYIAEESLPLLAPMVGDLVMTKKRECPACESDYIEVSQYTDKDNIKTIIRRNNKAFPDISYEN